MPKVRPILMLLDEMRVHEHWMTPIKANNFFNDNRSILTSNGFRQKWSPTYCPSLLSSSSSCSSLPPAWTCASPRSLPTSQLPTTWTRASARTQSRVFRSDPELQRDVNKRIWNLNLLSCLGERIGLGSIVGQICIGPVRTIMSMNTSVTRWLDYFSIFGH